MSSLINMRGELGRCPVCNSGYIKEVHWEPQPPFTPDRVSGTFCGPMLRWTCSYGCDVTVRHPATVQRYGNQFRKMLSEASKKEPGARPGLK
jgi:hypothetical protein